MNPQSQKQLIHFLKAIKGNLSTDSHKKLIEFLKTIKESVSKEEFLTGFKMLSGVLKETESNYDNKLKGIIEDTNKVINTFYDDMKTHHGKIDKDFMFKVLDNKKYIDKEISRVEKLIPKETDLSSIEERLNTLETEEVEEIEGKEIVEEINKLPVDTDDYKIDKEHIKGLVDEIKELRSLITSNKGNTIRGGLPRRRITKADLSSQCNGVTKTFTMPVDTMEVIGVWGTQFPVIFSATDWSFSGRTLTLGDSLSAPETNQSLWALIETL